MARGHVHSAGRIGLAEKVCCKCWASQQMHRSEVQALLHPSSLDFATEHFFGALRATRLRPSPLCSTPHTQAPPTHKHARKPRKNPWVYPSSSWNHSHRTGAFVCQKAGLRNGYLGHSRYIHIEWRLSTCIGSMSRSTSLSISGFYMSHA